MLVLSLPCITMVVFIVLFSYEKEVFEDWTKGVDVVAKANLDKPLIVRDPHNLQITVNFDPKVCAHYSTLSANLYL